MQVYHSLLGSVATPIPGNFEDEVLLFCCWNTEVREDEIVLKCQALTSIHPSKEPKEHVWLNVFSPEDFTRSHLYNIL